MRSFLQNRKKRETEIVTFCVITLKRKTAIYQSQILGIRFQALANPELENPSQSHHQILQWFLNGCLDSHQMQLVDDWDKFHGKNSVGVQCARIETQTIVSKDQKQLFRQEFSKSLLNLGILITIQCITMAYWQQKVGYRGECTCSKRDCCEQSFFPNLSYTIVLISFKPTFEFKSQIRLQSN